MGAPRHSGGETPAVAPPTGRPAPAPPQPVFATTGNARADSVLATLDATIAPFRQAPPPEQGAAGWVAQGLGGALGVINAPMMFIDAAASQGVSMVLDALGLSGLFPPMPVATIGLSMHLGTPHAHVHPPSLIPPAPPIPLPSLGIAFLAGSASVLVGGVPALRAGDIGIGFTCGSMAPPFEIMTGASGVYFGGARVARFGMDITFHCNPASPMGAFAIGMGVAGLVAGAAGAVAQASAGNTAAAAAQGVQAGLDAAALAISMLRGKDPAGPPGMGLLLGPPMGNVMAGGPPIPNIGALAQGKLYSALGRALRSMSGRLRRRTPPPDANGRTCEGGEPVHVVTGANYNTHLDFQSILGAFSWFRYTSSADHAMRGVLGWSWRHVFESRLVIELHRVTFEGYQGERIAFPRLRDADESTMHGYRLRRLSAHRFVVTHRRLGSLEFQRIDPSSRVARLIGVFGDETNIELSYDAHRRLHAIVERCTGRGSASATYTLRYDDVGQLTEVWGARLGMPSARFVRYHYDHAGLLLRAEDPAGRCDAYVYDGVHRIVRATDRTGYGFSWEYDQDGRCVKTQGEDGLWYAAFEYRPQEQTTRMTIHDGSAYSFAYDEDGVITKVVGPCGSVKHRIRALDGRVIAEVDAGGQRIDFLYDGGSGHVGRRDRFGHGFPPSLDASETPKTLARRFPSHARAHLLGELGATTRRRAEVIERRKDLRGNLVYERDSHGAERRWEFDAQGNQTLYVDRDGRSHRRAITSWGLVGAKIDPNGQATRYEHNPHQKVTKIVDPGGTVSRYVYDSHDRLVEVHRHGRLRERYVWDVGHRLIEKQDSRGRALLRIVPHDNALPGKIERVDGGVVELDYDAQGKVIRADTSEHRVTRRWDARRRLLLEDCDGHTVRHHHAESAITSTTIAGRFVCTWERHGDVVVVTDPSGYRRTLRHDADGSVRIEYGSGTSDLQQYDHCGRLLLRQWWPRATVEGAPVPWQVRHQYTTEGDLVATFDSARGTRVYRVDAVHRLVAVDMPDGLTRNYRYDAAGNLIEDPEIGRMRLDTGNRLQEAGGELFAYDDRDHVATRTGLGGFVTRYHYDGEDQLVRVDDGQEPHWTATYDGLGRRVTFGRGDRRTRLWWDGDRIAAQQGPDGGLRIYVYAEIDALVPLGFVDYDDMDAPRDSGRSHSVFCDQVGLPQHIEDAAGNVVWWADASTPYGEILLRPGSAIEYHLRFPGHLYDAELRLHYNRFRDYDPRLGRYLQSDPLGCAGAINLYAYPPNPLVAVDVLGLSHPSERETSAPTDDAGDSRPLTEQTSADGDAQPSTTPSSEPTAFPSLERGAGRTNEHAERVANMMDQLGTNDGRREVAARMLENEGVTREPTPQQIEDAVAPYRESPDFQPPFAPMNDNDVANITSGLREDTARSYDQQLQERADSLQLSKDEGSVTVMEHSDGSVTVGISGEDARDSRQQNSQALTDSLNGTYDDTSYHATSDPVDTSNLVQGDTARTTPGSCSEPHADQGAAQYNEQNGTTTTGYQTAWAGDDPPAAHQRGNPPERTSETGPTTMNPCGTCSTNGGAGHHNH